MKRISKFLSLTLLLIPSVVCAETLQLVTSLDPLEAKEYISAFEKDTGISVQWIRLSAGETLARLKSEAKNPSQDVWFGAPATEFVAAKHANLLEPYKSKMTEIIPKEWKDKDGYWTGVYFGAIVFVTRDNVIPPSSWQELLEPKFKGEVVVSYPYTAGTGYAIYAGLVSIMGEKTALDYYTKLDKQIRRYTKSGSSPIVDVGLEEIKIGIVFDQDALRKGISRGFPIQMAYPKDGVPYEIGGVAAIRGGNVDLAKRFIDWSVSLQAQDTMHKWYRVPLNPKAIVNEKSKKPKDLPLIKMDLEKAGLDRERLINEWRERVGK